MTQILQFFGELMIWFILGTITLWVASHATNSPNANIRTAAIANAGLTVIYAVLVGVAAIFLVYETGVMGAGFLVLCLLLTIVTFVFLMRIYAISLLGTIWLVIAMSVLGAVMETIIESIF